MWESYNMWKLETCIKIENGKIQHSKLFENPDLMAIHIESSTPNLLIYKEAQWDILWIGTAIGELSHTIQLNYYKEIALAMKNSMTYSIKYELE